MNNINNMVWILQLLFWIVQIESTIQRTDQLKDFSAQAGISKQLANFCYSHYQCYHILRAVNKL